MYFPRYWAKASVDGAGRLGDTVNVVAWGWSDVSNDDALAKAKARAQNALSRIPPEPGQARQAAYYEDRPFREPILQDHSQGSIKALITRNSFGCEVLNTDCVAFADIDYDPPRIGILDALFGARKKLGRGANHVAKRKHWKNCGNGRAQIHRYGSFRVYRTAGGLRLLRTSGTLQADSPQAKAWLEAVGSDPLYRKLCQNQKSFRARLTPKPWRCGLKANWTCAFPLAEPSEQATLEKWLINYQSKCASFAVCELLETMGSAMPATELKPLIALHDERTSVGKGLPLS